MSKILIIEDNGLMRESAKQILERSGHTVLEAADGPTGIAVARTDAPDLILLDLMMPFMPGEQVARYMRNDPVLRSIPVVILSAANQRQLVFDLLGMSNVRDYLLKPANELTLRQRVQAVLDATAAGGANNGQGAKPVDAGGPDA